MNAVTPTSDALDRRDWIAGLEKGLALLESFSEAHPRMTATQAAQRGGLTRTAARRYLLTLAHLGYVGTDNDGDYNFGKLADDRVVLTVTYER